MWTPRRTVTCWLAQGIAGSLLRRIRIFFLSFWWIFGVAKVGSRVGRVLSVSNSRRIASLMNDSEEPPSASRPCFQDVKRCTIRKVGNHGDHSRRLLTFTAGLSRWIFFGFFFFRWRWLTLHRSRAVGLSLHRIKHLYKKSPFLPCNIKKKLFLKVCCWGGKVIKINSRLKLIWWNFFAVYLLCWLRSMLLSRSLAHVQPQYIHHRRFFFLCLFLLIQFDFRRIATLLITFYWFIEDIGLVQLMETLKDT